MTTNKPEIAGYRWKTNIPDAIGGRYAYSYASHWSTGPREAENLILLSDYEALQVECEKLRKDAGMGRVVWKFVDRMNDVCPECDPADKILADFVIAINAAIQESNA